MLACSWTLRAAAVVVEAFYKHGEEPALSTLHPSQRFTPDRGSFGTCSCSQSSGSAFTDFAEADGGQQGTVVGTGCLVLASQAAQGCGFSLMDEVCALAGSHQREWTQGWLGLAEQGSSSSSSTAG